MPLINPVLTQTGVSSSKAIAQAARETPDILNLSIGEPAFGPPPYLLETIETQDLQPAPFLDEVKHYQHSRGAPELRRAVAHWYARSYGLALDPEHEILITHGGIEALNLALLTVSEPGDLILCADPGYSLYTRAIALHGRRLARLQRPAAPDEFAAALSTPGLLNARAWLLNSPENPTGYVASDADWQAIARAAERADCWVIHDEVYDTMAFTRAHHPARQVAGLQARSLLVNSCSKKFGVPGLRIGWLIAAPEIIEAATRAHECLCLSVGILAERIATRLLNDEFAVPWLETQRAALAERTGHAIARLNQDCGFRWDRQPMGGMFLFPDIRALHARLPAAYRQSTVDPGSAVARFLLQEKRIATVPGGVYGARGQNHIRLSTCGPAEIFYSALARLCA